MSKYLIPLFILSTLLMGTVLYFNNEPSGQSSTQVQDKNSPLSEAKPVAQTGGTRDDTLYSKKTELDKRAPNKPVTTPDKSLEKYVATQKALGFVPDDELAAYKAYSDETLKDLILQDDSYASEEYVIRSPSFEVKCERARHVVKHGSLVHSPHILGACMFLDAEDAQKDGRYDDAQELYREALSWYEVAVKLGNINIIDFAMEEVRRREEITLGEEDLPYISDIASRKIEEINQYRVDLGLEPLEKEVTSYTEELMPKDAWANVWARQFLPNK